MLSTDELKKTFENNFRRKPEFLFSAPGRTELGGNHTDHQHGRVLAAAVSLDTKAWAAGNGLGRIRVISEGFTPCDIDLADLNVREEETGTSAALIRGIAAGFSGRGIPVTGFDAALTSSVLPGSGLSSSASYEVLIGTILNYFTGNLLSPVDVAKIGQFAENKYYGKPSGLMDQTACACGGILSIDFEDTEHPAVTPVTYDFGDSGYQLCIINSGADHQNLTGEYAAITVELGKLCSFFGKKVLREIPEKDFYAHIPELEALAGDRAVLRAIHVYEENKRVLQELYALEKGDFEAYLRAVRASGASSWQYLQNVIPAGYKEHQEMALTLALTEHLLGGRGAARVQGGGFAGTIQAYVPAGEAEEFTEQLEAMIGKGRCVFVNTRREGGTLLKKLQ